jgi:hypothetical protein
LHDAQETVQESNNAVASRIELVVGRTRLSWQVIGIVLSNHNAVQESDHDGNSRDSTVPIRDGRFIRGHACPQHHHSSRMIKALDQAINPRKRTRAAFQSQNGLVYPIPRRQSTSPPSLPPLSNSKVATISQFPKRIHQMQAFRHPIQYLGRFEGLPVYNMRVIVRFRVYRHVVWVRLFGGIHVGSGSRLDFFIQSSSKYAAALLPK